MEWKDKQVNNNSLLKYIELIEHLKNMIKYWGREELM